MAKAFDRPPVEFRQVCAVARVVLMREPQLCDAEWKAETLTQIAKRGYDSPEADMLARALGAVERALEKTVGPRQQRAGPPTPAPTPVNEARRLTAKEWAALTTTLRRVVERTAATVPATVLPLAKATLAISEVAALDEFYIEAETDRMAALKRFAELAIERPAEWDVAQVRAESTNHRLQARECFGCRSALRGMNWHHVIQIQHGGSNYLRNRVALCDLCHVEIHPWLPRVAKPRTGNWFNVSDMATQMTGAVDAKRDARKVQAS